MKLYYTPGACSQAPHIVLHELGLPYEAVKVDLGTHTLPDGSDYRTINPKGYVPTLELDDGTRITEANVILQYLAEQKPGRLAPTFGTRERWKLMEWLAFIATEVHKGFSPLWKPTTPDAYKQIVKDNLATRFDMIEAKLAAKPYFAGDAFTVADAYLFTILNWSNFQKMDMGKWPNIQAYMGRVAARPKVQEALKAEGLVK